MSDGTPKVDVSGPAQRSHAPPLPSSGPLQALQELPLPTPVSYAPQTAGWALVAVLAIALLAWAAWSVRQRRRRQRYRRIALTELAGIEARLSERAQRAAALAAIPPLLKRTALAVVSRERVAALTGDEWLAFLQGTRGHFDARSGALLAFVSYAPQPQVAAVSDQEAATLVGHVRDWIEHHHVEV
jgi:Domain of unknown function (DUF4381)